MKMIGSLTVTDSFGPDEPETPNIVNDLLRLWFACERVSRP